MGMNPINQKLRPQNNATGLKTAMNMVKNAGNPQAMMMQMVRSHPKYNEAVQFMNSFSTPEEAFNTLAKQMGVDPNAFMNNLFNGLK